MTTACATTSSPVRLCGVVLHRFTVDEYHRLADADVLREGEPVELLDGWIVVKMDYGPPYGVAMGIPPQSLLEGRGEVPAPLRRFSVDEYHRMLKAEVLSPQLRTELVEGWVVDKMTRGTGHDSTLQRLLFSLIPRLTPQWTVRQQSAAVLDESEPEPDLVVVRGPVGLFDHRHPSPADIALVVEVSDTTLPYDRGAKLRTYARNYLPVYWIVNLVERQIEAYSDPSGPTESPSYRGAHIYRIGEAAPLVLAGQSMGEVLVEQVLPVV